MSNNSNLNPASGVGTSLRLDIISDNSIGVVFYLSMWYKRWERQYRIALFFAMASLAGAFGGVVAYLLGLMNGVGGYAGWVSNL